MVHSKPLASICVVWYPWVRICILAGPSFGMIPDLELWKVHTIENPILSRHFHSKRGVIACDESGQVLTHHICTQWQIFCAVHHHSLKRCASWACWWSTAEALSWWKKFLYPHLPSNKPFFAYLTSPILVHSGIFSFDKKCTSTICTAELWKPPRR